MSRPGVTCPDCGLYYPGHATGGHDICTCHEVKPPKPSDPFEEWWERDGCLVCASKKDSEFIWDAAIKWKEGQK